MKALFLWMACWIAMVGDARAEDSPATDESAFAAKWASIQEAKKKAEEAGEPSDFDKAFEVFDKQFGKWVVGPLATVMFYDVVFWDNQMALGEGVGWLEESDGRLLKITDFQSGQGYGRQEGFLLEAVTPVFDAPRDVTFGVVRGQIHSTSAGELMLQIPEQPVDLAALMVEPAVDMEASDPAAVVQATVKGLSFPVPVNRVTATASAVEGPAPTGVAMPVVGKDVMGPDGTRYALIGGSAGAWQVLSKDKVWSPDALANPENVALPIVVAWLVFGALFFTIRMLFINIRGVPHAILVTLGRYDDPEHEGEISHFQALSSALSATVGLGNIAGVAIAIGLGGPGAVFWMWVAGFLGMSSKFVECTLGQMYRVTDKDGSVSGGPMHYLDKGLAEMGVGPLGKVLSILFALMCIGGSFGGGNMFQANQSFEAIAKVVPAIADYNYVYGFLLMIAVGLVIIGGIKRIGAAASVVVPIMCGMYVCAGLYILAIHAAEVPAAFGAIVGQAFNPEAGLGGMVGVLAIGFQRASFSNEAGVGSASIAHSAAATDRPVREGVVALLEPFIDTIVVCSVTALVVVLTGVKVEPGSGIGPTMDAFATVIPWFPVVLAFAAMMFAFSTMVSWSYYGERCATFLFGDAARIPYRVVFLFFVFIGAILKLGSVLDFSDLMILGMAFPNILGALLLSGKVKRALDAYMADLKAGRFETH